jgi:hypothetical protein
MNLCPMCQAQTAASRVTLHRKAWSTSPAPFLSGYLSDLQTLITQGLAERRPDGWYVPTDTFPT